MGKPEKAKGVHLKLEKATEGDAKKRKKRKKKETKCKDIDKETFMKKKKIKEKGKGKEKKKKEKKEKKKKKRGKKRKLKDLQSMQPDGSRISKSHRTNAGAREKERLLLEKSDGVHSKLEKVA